MSPRSANTENESTSIISVSKELLQHTEGKTALFVSNRNEVNLLTSLRTTLKLKRLSYSDIGPRRVEAMARSIRQNTFDLILCVDGFIDHRADKVLSVAAKEMGIPYVRVHKGRTVSVMQQLCMQLGVKPSTNVIPLPNVPVHKEEQEKKEPVFTNTPAGRRSYMYWWLIQQDSLPVGRLIHEQLKKKFGKSVDNRVVYTATDEIRTQRESEKESVKKKETPTVPPIPQGEPQLPVPIKIDTPPKPEVSAIDIKMELAVQMLVSLLRERNAESFMILLQPSTPELPGQWDAEVKYYPKVETLSGK